MNIKATKIVVYFLVICLAALALVYLLDWIAGRLVSDESFGPINPSWTTPSIRTAASSDTILAKNQIKIFNDIYDSLAVRVIADIHRMEEDTSIQEIEILINSLGGTVTGTFLVCYAMKLSKKPIKTIAMGEALSGAAIILSSGAKYRRFATKGTQVMIHRPAVWISFTQARAEDLEETARILKLEEKLLFDLLHENTGQSVEQLKKDLRKNFYLNTKQAIEYGLIDSVYQK